MDCVRGAKSRRDCRQCRIAGIRLRKHRVARDVDILVAPELAETIDHGGAVVARSHPTGAHQMRRLPGLVEGWVPAILKVANLRCNAEMLCEAEARALSRIP